MRRSTSSSLGLAVLLTLVVSACSGTDDTPVPTKGTSSTEPTPSSAPPPPVAPGPSATDAPPPPPPTDGGVAAGTTLTGSVSRTAMIPPGQDGIGDLYVAVFDKNPIADSTAKPIGNQLVKGANLASPSAKVPYSVGGLPTNGGTVYVVAFLDDDGNAAADQKPHKPDLVTLDGIGPITIKLQPSGTTTKDLVLNAEMPF